MTINVDKRSQQLNAFAAHVFHHIDLEPEDLAPLLQTVYQQKYGRKSFVLNAGEIWNKLFYIHRGLIRLFYLDVDGKEFNKAFFAEGETIWPVAPQDREYGVLFNIAAIEATTVSVCPFPSLYEFLQKNGRWEKFALPFAETLVEQKFQREHDFLLLSATERLKRFSTTYPHIVRRLPDYHLASYLGITNVSLSRIKRATIH